MFVDDIKVIIPLGKNSGYFLQYCDFIVFNCIVLFPNLMKKLASWKLYQIVPHKTVDFFQEFIEDTIKRRKNKEVVRG